MGDMTWTCVPIGNKNYADQLRNDNTFNDIDEFEMNSRIKFGVWTKECQKWRYFKGWNKGVPRGKYNFVCV